MGNFSPNFINLGFLKADLSGQPGTMAVFSKVDWKTKGFFMVDSIKELDRNSLCIILAYSLWLSILNAQWLYESDNFFFKIYIKKSIDIIIWWSLSRLSWKTLRFLSFQVRPFYIFMTDIITTKNILKQLICMFYIPSSCITFQKIWSYKQA